MNSPQWKRFPTPFAGVDEAGRGCIAGPVAAGAVILPPGFNLPKLDDSKKLSAKTRAVLEKSIKQQALAWGVGLAWPGEIDTINILQATLQAMARAVNTLRVQPCYLAVDGNQTVPLAMSQVSIKGGDGKVPAIAAASILAKTFRDRLMTVFDRQFPGYGFAKHKGYGTRAHYDAVHRLGPCRLHRLTFKGVVPEDAKPQEQLCLPGI